MHSEIIKFRITYTLKFKIENFKYVNVILQKSARVLNFCFYVRNHDRNYLQFIKMFKYIHHF